MFDAVRSLLKRPFAPVLVWSAVVTLALAWPVAALFGLVWLAVAFVTRYSSLAALVASALTPFVLWWLALPDRAILFAVLTVLLWAKHHANIRRLLDGSEGKIKLG